MVDDSASFPGPGSLAQRLRKILYRDLTDQEVESIVVCLLAHSLVENSLNGVLYRWLALDAPHHVEKVPTEKARNKLWQTIAEMDFAKKYSLIAPFFSLHFPNEASNPWKLNDLRKDIAHGRIGDAKINGQPISEETAIKAVFIAAQATSRSLDDFEEILRLPHEYADAYRKRLKELGEPLA